MKRDHSLLDWQVHDELVLFKENKSFLPSNIRKKVCKHVLISFLKKINFNQKFQIFDKIYSQCTHSRVWLLPDDEETDRAGAGKVRGFEKINFHPHCTADENCYGRANFRTYKVALTHWQTGTESYLPLLLGGTSELTVTVIVPSNSDTVTVIR